MPRAACPAIGLLVHVVAMLSSTIAAAAASAAESGAPYGLERRVPWTTSNVRGRPEPPPPYRAQRVFSKLRFVNTTLLAVEPGTERLLVGERGGKVFLLPTDRDAAEAPVFLDCNALVERLNRTSPTPLALDAVYGLAFDPQYAANRYCYVCYVVRHADRARGQLADGTRVVRLRVVDGESPRCDPASEQLIVSWLEGGHNGGCLRFGPDGYLYISSGDGGNAFPPDGHKSGQDLTTLLAKILRIDVRASGADRPYSVPADNPFTALAGARPETWAYGLRNPWKMSFDRATGDLWVGDVGWELWELVYRVRRGDNFGWSIVEGSQPVHAEGKLGPTPIVRPTMEIPHTEGASITGGFVYRGNKLPELVGSYVFGDWETRRVWGARAGDDGLGERVELIDPTIRIVDFAEDRAGELFLLDYDDGSIYTLAPNAARHEPNRFPRKLSETGLFASAARHEAAPGVLPFSINSEQWSDGATAERYVAIPGDGAVRVRPKPRPVAGSQFSRAVDYPRDTVLLKTLSLETSTSGGPAARRRIETQVLHYDGREWLGYSYRWNDEQTDAELVDRSGENRTYVVHDPQAPGGRRTQTWRFAARAECIRCHNPWSEYALAFNTAQLNRVHDYGPVRDNQIRALRHVGLWVDDLTPGPDDPPAPLPLADVEDLPRLAEPFDDGAPLESRARSYLHVNCGHCHRFNGGGSSYLYLQRDLTLAETKAVGIRPTQGTFGIHDAQIVAPGDPFRSVLYFRLAKTGPGHMPHLGAKRIDEQGLALVHDWIRSLPVRFDDAAKVARLIEIEESSAAARDEADRPRAEWRAARRAAQRAGRDQPNDADLMAGRRTATTERTAAVAARAAERTRLIAELLTAPASASFLAEALRAGRLPQAIRRSTLDAAQASGIDPAVRDLFEAFVPEELQTKRLGEVVDSREILKLAGDVERGRRLFHESTVVQCRNCHRIGGRGISLGPDLDDIGRKLDRAKLLESILQPSLAVDPKFAVWLIETKSGRVLSGLKVRQTDDEIVVRDAQNKEHRVPSGDVDGVYPQAKSLMPELQLRDFTAAQAADLLAYLATLRAAPGR